MLFELLLVLVIVALSGFVLGGLSGAPWVPAYERDLPSLFMDFKLKRGQSFVELGCGDGRVVAVVAAKGFEAVGYEINPLLWLRAWLRNRRYPNAHIRLANFWRQDLSGADVVFAFLIPRTMPRLERKLQELKPGARLVSYIFKLPTRKPSLSRDHWFIYD